MPIIGSQTTLMKDKARNQGTPDTAAVVTVAASVGAVVHRTMIFEESPDCVQPLQFTQNKMYRLLVTVTNDNNQDCNK